MAAISDLRDYYSGKDLVADGGTPPTYTADSGTVRTVVDAALTEAISYWKGAILYWVAGGNIGLWSTVEDFSAAADTLTLDEDLPVAAAIADTFKLYLPLGGYRSSVKIESLLATAPVNCTGMTFDSVGGYNGMGNGTLNYYINAGGATRAAAWTAPGDAIGAQVAIGGGNGTYALYSADGSKWVKVTVVIASLPVGNQNDTIALTQSRHRLFGPIRGPENTTGITRHALFVKYNEAATALNRLYVYLKTGEWINSAGATQTATDGAVAAAGYADAGAITLPTKGAATWPSVGHVLNVNTDEIMQFNSRSGDNLIVAATGRGIRGTAAAAGLEDHVLKLIPPVDIGLDAPGAGEIYEIIANEETAPGGVSFSHPITSAAGLVIGDLAATKGYGIWLRYVHTAGGTPSLNVLSAIRVACETSEA